MARDARLDRRPACRPGRKNEGVSTKKSCGRNLPATLNVHSVRTERFGKDATTTMSNESVVSTCRDLATGDLITARYKGALVHRGRVTERIPERGLFWIMDDLTGGRRLLDMAELEILRAHIAGTGPMDPRAEAS